jgi:hypothetical protein
VRNLTKATKIRNILPFAPGILFQMLSYRYTCISKKCHTYRLFVEALFTQANTGSNLCPSIHVAQSHYQAFSLKSEDFSVLILKDYQHILFFIIILLFYYSYVHTRLGSFLPPAPPPPLPPSPPPLSPPTPSIPGRNYFALISNFVVERV